MSYPKGSIEDNTAKGRGIGEKEPFKVVGMNPDDLKTGGHNHEDKRGRGRPAVDKNWTPVGKEVNQEQGGSKPKKK